MSFRKRWTLAAAIALTCVAADQTTKWIAQETLSPERLVQSPDLSWPKEGPLKDLFRLQYARNPGAFLSLFAGLPDEIRVWVLLGINSVILTTLLLFLGLKRDLTYGVMSALSLVLSGGIGNLLDRLFREDHEVVDFMNMGIGGLRTGIFNVADLAIVGGVTLLLVIEVFGWGSHPADTSNPAAEKPLE